MKIVPGIVKPDPLTSIPRPDETDTPETEMDWEEGMTETEPPPGRPVEAEIVWTPLETDAEIALLETDAAIVAMSLDHLKDAAKC